MGQRTELVSGACDSSGLKLFLQLHRRFARQGGSLHLAALLPPVAAEAVG
jgi:anti-anti-sigma regulatory factor